MDIKNCPGVSWQFTPLVKLLGIEYPEGTYIPYCVDGYDMTRRVINAVTPGMLEEAAEIYGHRIKIADYIPAVMGAYDTSVEYRMNHIHGYLPDIGQLMIVSRNVDDINACLEIMRNRPVTKLPKSDQGAPHISGRWWSCREYSDEKAMFLEHDRMWVEGYKTHGEMIALPLFRIF